MDYKIIFNTVLQELVEATNCHACGEAYYVILKGYHKTFCCKGCWLDNMLLNGNEYCVFGNYGCYH